tara:strand:- start:2262 stop:2639 length:378 start_codon:yes stop_codon:yes gene_type:complete
MKLLTILLALILVGCSTTPTNPEFWMEREINACLPTAIVFRQSLKKYNVWAEVFRYSWVGKEDHKIHGHAMVAYLYPPGKNQLWTYDSHGSYRVRAFTNNVSQIAQEAHNGRGGSEKTFLVEYIK